jgi:hypothetical protein
VYENGGFTSSLEGGDVGGSTRGVWELSAGALVLLPSPGTCTLRDGNFDDACLRVYDTDLDPNRIRVGQQQSFNDIVSFEWQRDDACTNAERPKLAPRDDVCNLDAIEPVDAQLTTIEMHLPSQDGVARGRLIFSIARDLSLVDLHDIQRSLLASVQAFSLRATDGSAVALFERHAPWLSEEARSDPNRSPLQDEPGEFRVHASSSLYVDFVHELTTLPDVLELSYEFNAAKYITDTLPRIERLPVAQ